MPKGRATTGFWRQLAIAHWKEGQRLKTAAASQSLDSYKIDHYHHQLQAINERIVDQQQQQQLLTALGNGASPPPPPPMATDDVSAFFIRGALFGRNLIF